MSTEAAYPTRMLPTPKIASVELTAQEGDTL